MVLLIAVLVVLRYVVGEMRYKSTILDIFYNLYICLSTDKQNDTLNDTLNDLN